jgi:hypothetical protein
MSIYAGQDQYPLSFTLPDDNQPATAASVDDQVKGLADRGVYIFRRVGMMSDPAGPVAMACADGTSIQIKPVGGVVVTDAANVPRFIAMPATSITVAQLDTGAAFFDGSKNYAIYLYFDTNAGLPKYVISATMPEASGFFMSGTVSHRFLGGFCTDATAKIRRFTSLRGEVRYHSPVGIVLAGNQTVATSVDLAVKALPPYAGFAALRCETIASVVGGGTATIGADFAGGAGWRSTVGQGAGDRAVLLVDHFPMSADQKMEYFVNANTTTLTVELLGYSF